MHLHLALIIDYDALMLPFLHIMLLVKYRLWTLMESLFCLLEHCFSFLLSNNVKIK